MIRRRTAASPGRQQSDRQQRPFCTQSEILCPQVKAASTALTCLIPPTQLNSWRRRRDSYRCARLRILEVDLNKLAVIEKEQAEGAGPKTGTIGSAIAVLHLLSEAEYPLGVNAIARELSLAPSSCFKILKSLLAHDFVEIDNRTKGYSLGAGAITVARRALDPARAFATIRPRLEALAQVYSIAIGLWRLLPNGRMVLVGFAEGNSQMRIHMSVGSRLPILVGAVGRAIAARLDLNEEELREQFTKLRWQTPIGFEEYLEQVKQAKRNGYGFDQGNFAPGVTTVATAIADDAGMVRYGLSGIMFAGQHDAETIEKIARDLAVLAKWSSARLVSTPVR